MGNNLSTLLPILQCPICQSGHIETIATPYPEACPFESANQHLQCSNCQVRFPITEDDIPVMWTDTLKVQMMTPPDLESNIGANLQIYNKISDDYMHFTRQLPENALRIQDGAGRILAQAEPETPRYHLDFGCGPGQVLSWLREMDLVSIGLDVSFVNLRNARKTGAYIVCGDATRMPFQPDSFVLVTEASVLHHIQDWQAVVREACRVCHSGGGLLFDAEPSREMVAFSRLAVWIFNLRFPAYKLLSYIWRDKYIFRNTEMAKLNLKAEIHHQPGTGFPLDKLDSLFKVAGFNLHLYHAPGASLDTIKPPKIQNIILNLLSLRNPWNPNLGSFTAIGTASTEKPNKGSTHE